MRVCRNNGLAALAAAAIAFLSGAAHAQQGAPAGAEALPPGPIQLRPPTSLKPAPQPEPAPVTVPAANAPVQPDYKAGPAGQSVTTLTSVGASGIQVDRLQVVTPDSAGILTTENGGFGVDMWRGASMASAMEMLSRVPARIGSPTLAGLVRRLVLTPAAPPEGPSDGEQLAVKRLELLVAMADYPAALDLLSVMPRQGRGPGLLRAEAELRFLTGDNVAGCGLVSGEVRRNQADFWQKALIFCQLLSDQPEKAELGISMLRELGNDDKMFFRISEAMSMRKSVALDDTARTSPLVTAMLAHVQLDTAPAALATLGPAALHSLALNAKLAAPLRLVAAERAAMLGVFGDSALRKLVLKIAEQLPPEGDAQPLPDGAAGSVARARLYAAAQRAGVPAAKAEAASRALRLALDDGVYRATAQLFRDELAVVPASTENTWFATDAVRASAANGAIEQARSWILLLKRSALLSPESADVLVGLQSLARVMGEGSAGTQDGGPLKAADGRRTVIVRAIMTGLGQPTDAAAWLTLADPLEDGVARPPMPAPALWFAFRAMNGGAATPQSAPLASDLPPAAGIAQVAEAGVVVRALDAPTPGARADLDNKAARVLVMARLAGQGHPAELNPIVLAEVIRALTIMGLDTEARAFALEAALGAGL
jgi:hypothetical protein